MVTHNPELAEDYARALSAFETVVVVDDTTRSARTIGYAAECTGLSDEPAEKAPTPHVYESAHGAVAFVQQPYD